MLLHILLGQLIDREYAVLSACLYSHIGDREAVIHCQVFDPVTDELHGLIQCSVHSDHADYMQDNVLAAYIRSLLSGYIESDRSGYLEPRLAGGHARSHIRRTDTCRKGSQRTVGAGMRIGTDDHVSGYRQSLFRQKGMLNSHFTHFKVVGYVMFECKFPDTLAMLRTLDILIRYEMIGNQGDLILIEHPVHLHLLHFLYCNGTGNVVSEHQIQIRLDQISGLNPFKSGMSCQDLLRHCHAHK